MATKSDPLITVIVAVCDVAPWVGEAIASLRVQTLCDFEALVIDDGSRDDSAAVALAAIGGDTRFRLIRQENRGLSAARNAGLALARGEWVAFLDGDDAFAPGFLAALHGGCLRHGADWAACAVMLCTPDGEVWHSGFHPGSRPETETLLDLRDARQVAQVFPSAWNKLWRREALGDLRFPEGLWFEDHPVFWAMAARAPRLVWLREGLVRHRRERPGQITGRDDERVFDVLTVLDRLHPLVTKGFVGGAAAFDRLASRLVGERFQVLRDPGRMARFLEAARALFARLELRWQDDPEMSRAYALAMAGEVPLTVRADRPDAAQGVPGAEVLAPGGTPRGRYLLHLAPGEVPLPRGLCDLIDKAERSGAPLVVGGLTRAALGWHDGWCDNRHCVVDAEGRIPMGPAQALRLYPALGNLLVRREGGVRRPDNPGATEVQQIALATALAAGWAVRSDTPAVAVPDAPSDLPDLWQAARWAAALPTPAPGMPRGWRGLLFLRMVRLRYGRRLLPSLAALALAVRHGWLAPHPDARPDPETPRWLRGAITLGQRAPIASDPPAGDNRAGRRQGGRGC